MSLYDVLAFLTPKKLETTNARYKEATNKHKARMCDILTKREIYLGTYNKLSMKEYGFGLKENQ